MNQGVRSQLDLEHQQQRGRLRYLHPDEDSSKPEAAGHACLLKREGEIGGVSVRMWVNYTPGPVPGILIQPIAPSLAIWVQAILLEAKIREGRQVHE